MKKIFVILSNQNFDSELKTNKWHIATKLAKRGHYVIYVDPPLRFKAIKNYLTGKSSKIFGIDKKKENLVVFKPISIFNFFPFSFLNTYLFSKTVNSLIHSYAYKITETETIEPINEPKVIMWIYHFDFPDLENFIKKIKYDLSLYDCVDEYSAFPEYAAGKKVNPTFVAAIQSVDDWLKVRLNQHGLSGAEWVMHREKWLADVVDLVFVSAPGLAKKFKSWKKNPHYIPNAAEVEAFDKDKSVFIEPDDIKNVPHPRIGFSGAIDAYKNNIHLIEKSAAELVDYHFIMIGPEKFSDPDLDLSKLKSMSNVHFLGVKKWESTPAYFAYFDVYFIPYNLNDYTVGGCFPVKYFEGLSAGLPTVVTDLPAYEGFDPDGYVSKTDDAFVKNLRKAVTENNPQKIAARKLMASQNSYEGKVDKELKLIDDALN